MAIQTTKAEKLPDHIDVVQVTVTNFFEVGQWAGFNTVRTTSDIEGKISRITYFMTNDRGQQTSHNEITVQLGDYVAREVPRVDPDDDWIPEAQYYGISEANYNHNYREGWS